MQIEDLKPGLIGVGTSFGASICCVLPMTIVLLGLGSGGFMMVTMQYRIILYPLGLLGLVTAYWLYFHRRKVCDAQACRMQGKRWNIVGLVFSTFLMSLVTYVDFFLVSLCRRIMRKIGLVFGVVLLLLSTPVLSQKESRPLEQVALSLSGLS